MTAMFPDVIINDVDDVEVSAVVSISRGALQWDQLDFIDSAGSGADVSPDGHTVEIHQATIQSVVETLATVGYYTSSEDPDVRERFVLANITDGGSTGQLPGS